MKPSHQDTLSDQKSGNGLRVAIRSEEPVGLDVSLNCDAGELMALVGPSGSGKSTVLRIIAGLNRVNHAHIICAGSVWDDTAKSIHISPQKRLAGLVFQEYALFPNKSAIDNVMLATPGKTRAQRLRKAMALLECTNMTGLEKRMPATLSGGQKQRVALARALAREPQVLLLDEPFSAVDQQTRRKLYRELAALRRTLEIPIVLVTHDLGEVQLLADSLSLIHRGSSLQQGSVADVINRPLSREIARLVGHQNLFNASVAVHAKNHTIYQVGNGQSVRGPRLAELQVGDNASLLISPSAINLQSASTLGQSITHRGADKAQDGDTTLTGTVQESLILGDELSIRLHLDEIPKSLRFKLPMQLVASMGIAQGSQLTISVQPHGVHAMSK